MGMFSGREFLTCSNNNTTSLADSLVIRSRDQRDRIINFFEERATQLQVDWETRGVMIFNAEAGINHVPDVPIFTFNQHAAEYPWFTGDLQMYYRLGEYIKKEGGNISSASFYVPFSNGIELATVGKDYDFQRQRREFRFVTTTQQFRETFGLTIESFLKMR